MQKSVRKLLCTIAGMGVMITGTALPAPAAAADTGSKLIALTFDDGPNTTTTNDVLDLLEEYDAKASFFLIGVNINEESAKSVKRAYDMGCEIDNHSKTHSNMGGMDAATVKEEIDYVDEWVEQITGEKTRFFRPPFIDVSDSLYDAVDLPFICGIDCQDYMENVTAEERANYILNGAKDGTIVLLHDAAGNSQTVEALKIAMPELKAQGYEFVTLTELFERQGETPKDYLLYTYVTKYPCRDYALEKTLFTGEVSGTSGDAVWSQLPIPTPAEFAALGDTWAIEMQCVGGAAPVMNLQKWSGESVWQSVQPAYYNGETACFLAEDIQAALDALGVEITDLDRIGISAYTSKITVTQVDLLTKAGGTANEVRGDVNGDGACTLADAVAIQQFLIAERTALKNADAADLNQDGKINGKDLTLLKRILLQ